MNCLTHASASVAEAKFFARQAAERLLAFQMQQSEAELNWGDDRCHLRQHSCNPPIVA